MRRRIHGVVVVIVLRELRQRVENWRFYVHNHFIFSLQGIVNIDGVSCEHVVRAEDLLAVQGDLSHGVDPVEYKIQVGERQSGFGH